MTIACPVSEKLLEAASVSQLLRDATTSKHTSCSDNGPEVALVWGSARYFPDLGWYTGVKARRIMYLLHE